MNNRETGKLYEERAACYLSARGFTLLEKNYRSRQGEVDLIGIHEDCLVFVEVKYRKTAFSGLPQEAVGTAKQRKICRVSDYYRLSHVKEGKRQVRFDVVAIRGEEICWHQNAFPYIFGVYGGGKKYSW